MYLSVHFNKIKSWVENMKYEEMHLYVAMSFLNFKLHLVNM